MSLNVTQYESNLQVKLDTIASNAESKEYLLLSKSIEGLNNGLTVTVNNTSELNAVTNQGRVIYDLATDLLYYSDGSIWQTALGLGYTGSRGYTGSIGYTGSQGATGTSTSLFNYKAKTNSTTGSPGSGFLLWNNATQTSASNVHVHHVSADGQDLDIFLTLLTTDQAFTIQDRGDSDNYQIWQISATPVRVDGVDAYWQIPVTLLSSSGTGTTGFSNNQDLFLAITAGIKGYTGSQGITGFTGSFGYTGSQGITGFTGSFGYTGSQGDLGYTGSQGVTGFTGSQGIQGFTGSAGGLSANVTLTAFNETVVTTANISGNVSLDVSTGTIFKANVTGNISNLTLGNATAGTSAALVLTQTGSFTLTTTSAWKFAGNSKTLSATTNSIDIISVFYDGTTYYAALSKGYA